MTDPKVPPSAHDDQPEDSLFDRDYLSDSDSEFLAELDRVLETEAMELAQEVPDCFIELANEFWPGPLTLIVRRNAAIALGNSGDLRFYEWRFPLLWEEDIKREAKTNKLDPAWVYGIIRAESAMVETARSSANALGLMQVTPATGKRVAKKHGIKWNGNRGLQTAAHNLPIGTALLGDLLKDYQHNPVLVSGAYNAGRSPVKRWLENRPAGEAAIWIETLPYFETRDYIPRVLAFTTIYDWRMGGEVKRISTRMPDIESGKISVRGSTGVVCSE